MSHQSALRKAHQRPARRHLQNERHVPGQVDHSYHTEAYCNEEIAADVSLHILLARLVHKISRTKDTRISKAVRPSLGCFVSKLLRTTSTFQALPAVRTTAIRHPSSSIATCSLYLVTSLSSLTSSLRFVVAFTCHVLSPGQQQTATDHSPHVFWSPQRASSDAECQEEACAGAARWYKCLSPVRMEGGFSFLL